MEGNTNANANTFQQLIPPSVFSTKPCTNLLPPGNIRVSEEKPSKKSVRMQTDAHTSDDEVGYSPSKSKKCAASTAESKHFNSPVSAGDLEIEKLRRENYQLLAENLKQTYQSCTRVQDTSQSSTNKHVDSLISKQSEEINQLRQQLADEHNKHERTLTNFDQECIRREKAYQNDLDILNSQHEKVMANLKREFSEKERCLEHNLTEVRSECETQQQEMSRLFKEVEKQKAHNDNVTRNLELISARLSESKSVCEDKDKKIAELQQTVSSYQQRLGGRERWPQEKSELELKLSNLMNDNETLRGENEGLNLRLLAINDVLSAQQDTLRVDNSADGKLHNLLNRWRTKVFSMLVQQKSSELVFKADTNKWEGLTRSLEDQVFSLRARIRELEAMVKERDVQVDLLSKQKQKLELSSQKLRSLTSTYESEKERELEAQKLLTHTVQGFSTKFESQRKVLEAVGSHVTQYEARLLAVNTKFLQCKDFLLSTQSKCADLNERLQVSENECESLRQQLADSNLVKQDYQQKHDQLQRSLLDYVKAAEDQEKTISHLKDRIDQLTVHADLEAKRVELEVTRPYKDSVAKHQEEISNLKRQLTKTTVLLRRSERQNEQNQDSHGKELNAVMSQNAEKLSRLTSDLTAAQVEKNIVQSTLTALTNSNTTRAKPRVSQSHSVFPQTTPVKSQPVVHSLPTSPLGRKLAAASASKLAASIINSDTDSDSEDCSNEGA